MLCLLLLNTYFNIIMICRFLSDSYCTSYCIQNIQEIINNAIVINSILVRWNKIQIDYKIRLILHIISHLEILTFYISVSIYLKYSNEINTILNFVFIIYFNNLNLMASFLLSHELLEEIFFCRYYFHLVFLLIQFLPLL